MKVDMTKFWKEVAELSIENRPTWRKGQTYFNALYVLYPEVANKVRATPLDPFYNDGAIDKFVKHLEELA